MDRRANVRHLMEQIRALYPIVHKAKKEYFKKPTYANYSIYVSLQLKLNSLRQRLIQGGKRRKKRKINAYLRRR